MILTCISIFPPSLHIQCLIGCLLLSPSLSSLESRSGPLIVCPRTPGHSARYHQEDHLYIERDDLYIGHTSFYSLLFHPAAGGHITWIQEGEKVDGKRFLFF